VEQGLSPLHEAAENELQASAADVSLARVSGTYLRGWKPR